MTELQKQTKKAKKKKKKKKKKRGENKTAANIFKSHKAVSLDRRPHSLLSKIYFLVLTQFSFFLSFFFFFFFFFDKQT